MQLSDILQQKGHQVHTIAPSASLKDVADQLVKNNCGSLVVVNDHGVQGIITERDILRAAAAHQEPLEQARVRDHMSTDLQTGSPHDSLTDAMGLMTQHRVRHLPITDQDRLVGIISIGDVVKAQHTQLMMENHYLKNYIQS